MILIGAALGYSRWMSVVCQRNQNNLKVGEWANMSNTIIDASIAMFPLDLPAYVLLEIIDCLPFFRFVEHKKKIDLIINVKKSMQKLKKTQAVHIIQE